MIWMNLKINIYKSDLTLIHYLSYLINFQQTIQ